MRKSTRARTIAALVLAAIAAPLPADEETLDNTTVNHFRQADETKPGPCPTEIEVLPYQWIEPTTGNEYTVLRLHCPGRDDLSGDPWQGSGTGDSDARISEAVRGAG